jgi:hypothetical protein
MYGVPGWVVLDHDERRVVHAVDDLRSRSVRLDPRQRDHESSMRDVRRRDVLGLGERDVLHVLGELRAG